MKLLYVTLSGLVCSLAAVAGDYETKLTEVKSKLAKNEASVETQLAELIALDQVKAARDLCGLVPQINNDRLYWLVVASLSRLDQDAAVAEVLKALRNTSILIGVRRDLFLAMQQNVTEAGNRGLIELVKRSDPDIRVMAIEEVGRRKLKEAVDPLIEVMKSEEDGRRKDGAIHAAARDALALITGKTINTAADWKTWWDQNRDTFKPEAFKPRGDGFRGQLDARKTAFLDDVTKTAKKEEIVVVTGVFDEVQKVLEKLGIPHTIVTKDQFAKLDLKHCKVLLINCDDHMQTPFSSDARKKITQFVAGGGYLWTSDWALEDVLIPCFPGYVKKGSPEWPQDNVDVVPAKGMNGHPLLKDVFQKVRYEGAAPQGGGTVASKEIKEKIDHRWEIDAVSFLIDPDPKLVTVLAESPDLEKKGTKFNAVAITFTYGPGGGKNDGPKNVSTGFVDEKKTETPKRRPGKVLHILSHFGKQRNQNDEYSLQHMLLNFIMEVFSGKR